MLQLWRVLPSFRGESSLRTFVFRVAHNTALKHARTRKRDTRRPDLDTVFTINPDGSRNFLHPADVHGRFQSRKNFLWGVLLAIWQNEI